MDGTFTFVVNTTDVDQVVGSLPAKASTVAIHVDGNVVIGSFVITATLDVKLGLNNSNVVTSMDLAFSGTAKLGPLGSLGANAHLVIDGTGLYGYGSLTVGLTAFSGFTLKGAFQLQFNTGAGDQNLDGVSLPHGVTQLSVKGAELSLGNGAFVVTGDMTLQFGNSTFTIQAEGSMTVLGASLGGTLYAKIFNDGQTELVLYASLSLKLGELGGSGFSLSANPVLQINTTSTAQVVPNVGNTIGANTVELDLNNAQLNLFGFTASGTLIARVSDGGFDIQVPQSNPLTINFFGIASMQIYGDINSDGTFNVTGTIGYDVEIAGFELYGQIGATISNDGFYAWFSGGANIDFKLHKFHLFSVYAGIGIESSHVWLRASIDLGFLGTAHFNADFGSAPAPPKKKPGLGYYSAPASAGNGQAVQLNATIYDNNGNGISDGSYYWTVYGPNNFVYTTFGETPTVTLVGEGQYNVALYRYNGGSSYSLQKQSAITVFKIAPTINYLNVEPSYVTNNAALAITPYPAVYTANSATTGPNAVTYAWSVVKNGDTAHPRTYTGYNATITLDKKDPLATAPDTYDVTLTVNDPLNGSVSATQHVTTFDINNLTVNSAADDQETGDPKFGAYDFIRLMAR